MAVDIFVLRHVLVKLLDQRRAPIRVHPLDPDAVPAREQIFTPVLHLPDQRMQYPRRVERRPHFRRDLEPCAFPAFPEIMNTNKAFEAALHILRQVVPGRSRIGEQRIPSEFGRRTGDPAQHRPLAGQRIEGAVGMEAFGSGRNVLLARQARPDPAIRIEIAGKVELGCETALAFLPRLAALGVAGRQLQRAEQAGEADMLLVADRPLPHDAHGVFGHRALDKFAQLLGRLGSQVRAGNLPEEACVQLTSRPIANDPLLAAAYRLGADRTTGPVPQRP